MRHFLGIGACALLLQACASSSTWTPTVDTRGAPGARYQADLAACREYAEANPEADAETAGTKSAVKWGAGAAAASAAAVLLSGGALLLPLAATSAAVNGGVAAGVSGTLGAGKANERYRAIVTKCLEGRGHKVID